MVNYPFFNSNISTSGKTYFQPYETRFSEISGVLYKYSGTVSGDNPPVNYKNIQYSTIAQQPFIWNLIEKIYEIYPRVIALFQPTSTHEILHLPYQVSLTGATSGQIIDSWKHYNNEYLGYTTNYEESTNLKYNYTEHKDIDRDGTFHMHALNEYLLSGDTHLDMMFMDKHYSHLGRYYSISGNNNLNIQAQLSGFLSDVKSVSGKQVAQYHTDMFNNSFYLYKENRDQLLEPGFLWMRYRNHPIGFPIYKQEHDDTNQLYLRSGNLNYDNIVNGGCYDFDVINDFLLLIGNNGTEDVVSIAKIGESYFSDKNKPYYTVLVDSTTKPVELPISNNIDNYIGYYLYDKYIIIITLNKWDLTNHKLMLNFTYFNTETSLVDTTISDVITIHNIPAGPYTFNVVPENNYIWKLSQSENFIHIAYECELPTKPNSFENGIVTIDIPKISLDETLTTTILWDNYINYVEFTSTRTYLFGGTNGMIYLPTNDMFYNETWTAKRGLVYPPKGFTTATCIPEQEACYNFGGHGYTDADLSEGMFTDIGFDYGIINITSPIEPGVLKSWVDLDSSILQDADMYKPEYDTWLGLLNMTEPMDSMASSVMNNSSWLFTGTGLMSNRSKVLEFTGTEYITHTNFPNAKSHAMAQATDDNTTYLFSGESTSAIFRNSRRFDRITDSWSNNLGNIHYTCAASIMMDADSNIHIIGGRNNNAGIAHEHSPIDGTYVDTHSIFNPTTETATVGTSHPTTVAYFNSASILQPNSSYSGFTFGGVGNSLVVTNSTYKLEFDTDSWSVSTNLMSEKESYSISSYEKRSKLNKYNRFGKNQDYTSIYLFGGMNGIRDQFNISNSTQEFDNYVWKEKTPMLYNRAFINSTYYDRYTLLFGGVPNHDLTINPSNLSTGLKFTSKYNSQYDTYEYHKDMLEQRNSFGSARIGLLNYVYGGIGQTNLLTTMDAYDDISTVWLRINNLPVSELSEPISEPLTPNTSGAIIMGGFHQWGDTSDLINISVDVSNTSL